MMSSGNEHRGITFSAGSARRAGQVVGVVTSVRLVP